MNTDVDLDRLNGLTEAIIGCAYRVANKPGCGFLEKVYENAMVLELRKAGLKVEPLKPVIIYYDDVIVGEYFADLLVEDSIIVEIKAVKAFDDAHSAQCINYLAATKPPICLLIDFGKPRIEIKRFAGHSMTKATT